MMFLDIHRGYKVVNLLNRLLSHEDAGRLLLRLAVGGLMLFHGMSKLMTGASGIKALLASYGLPEFIAYGTILGEVVAPIFIILGILTRPSALLVAFTMVRVNIPLSKTRTGDKLVFLSCLTLPLKKDHQNFSDGLFFCPNYGKFKTRDFFGLLVI